MKKFIILFKQSLRAISANKVRSFLTMLGVIIGIGSVIGLTSLGEGANRSITDRINELGTTTLTVMPGQSFSGDPFGEHDNNERPPNASAVSSLTTADVDALKNPGHSNISAVAGEIFATSVVAHDSAQFRLNVDGVSDSYFGIRNISASSGRLFNAQDGSVAVIGSKAAKNLFGDVSPLGQKITLNKTEFEVVGVLNEADEGSFGNPNNQVFIPLATAQNIFKISNLSNIIVQAKDKDVVDAAKQDIEQTLYSLHGITDPKLADFSVTSPKDLLSAVNQITGLLTALLAGIAGISLVVGGIGIMNIMLVAVTERTREIGLRKAVGAKTSDIMIQFLFEAVFLTLLGCVFGIAVGYGIGFLASQFIDLTPVVTLKSLLTAVGVSSAIGIGFGIYPAAKASRLNPIDALRYE